MQREKPQKTLRIDPIQPPTLADMWLDALSKVVRAYRIARGPFCYDQSETRGFSFMKRMNLKTIFCNKSLVLIFLVLLALPVRAQFTPAPQPVFQAWNNSFQPCGGCLLYSYIAGTSTPLATYTDATGGTPNSNPVVLNSAGRANVWFSPTAYKLVLQTPTGLTIYTVDQLIANVSALLALNNTWSGTNTFNGLTTFNSLATFNSGLTSSGPNTLNGGGTLSGTFSGSPTFSGTPNFAAGFTVASLTVTGQIISTLATGTPPFVIASTTNVPNLNASSINGCTFPIPCPLGSTTPNTAVFTTLQANTSFTLNGGTAQTGVQGTDTSIMTAANVGLGAGLPLCTDTNHGATTTGCVPVSPANYGDCTVGGTCTATTCPTGAGASSSCTITVPLHTTQLTNTYAASCTGIGPTGVPYVGAIVKNTGNIVVTITNGQGSAAVASTFTEMSCTVVGP
jgi:hypothetical protein